MGLSEQINIIVRWLQSKCVFAIKMCDNVRFDIIGAARRCQITIVVGPSAAMGTIFLL